VIVVFDTNVLLPLILGASRSARLLARLEADGHRIATTPQILDEVREKLLTGERLRRWLKLSDESIPGFLDDLANICVTTPGTLEVRGAVVDDPDDDMIIAAAVESGAAFIVTEDRHLLDLGRWQGIEIVTREQLLARLGPGDEPGGP